MLGSLNLHAQINENFNSREALSVYDVKGYLQNRCWIFNGIEMNASSPIEGDGSLVTVPNSFGFSSIYTPVLDVPGNISVSFKYAVDQNFVAGEKKIVTVYLTDDFSTIAGAPIGVLEITNAVIGQTYTANFSKTPVGSGGYRVLILIESENGSTPLIIDEVTTSAPTYYLTGCNATPIAIADTITGANDYTASGDVTVNDYDPNGLGFTVYMIDNSFDGTVTLNTNGTFSFVPNPGFNGRSTTFTYQICNWGLPELCSEIVTVVINFPNNKDGLLPVSLINFQGTLREDGKGVHLSWRTNFEQNNKHFEVERSFNGIEWTTVGTVKGAGNSSVVVNYEFDDQLGKITMARNDLYYRLKQVDEDGKYKYTKILVVRIYNTKNINSIAATPNPVVNDINVTIDLTEDAYGSFKVYNATGVEVLRKSGKLKRGSQTITIENSNTLPAGMYFLEVIINGKERMVIKLMKD